MEGGPLLSALQDHQIYPMRTEQQVKMSTEDMRHLLILMGTITVISFVLVVSVVTILLAFVWYTRNRLSSGVKCSCTGRNQVEGGRVGVLEAGRSHHDHHQIPNQNYPRAGLKTQLSPFPVRHHNNNLMPQQQYQPSSLPYSSPNLPVYIHGNPSLYSSHTSLPTRYIQGSVIVNPLPPSAAQAPEPEPLAKQEEPVAQDSVVDEPIYAEIKPKMEEACKEEVTDSVTKEDEGKSSRKGKKKEVEYWQITAKEVVKFRPCTETFIHRS